jgi:hypothetical protein
MKTAFILAISALLTQQGTPPKNDPNGNWEAETGTKYELRLSGDDLRVQIVEGSHPVFLKYEVNLKNTGEVNTYKGTGYFIAKMKTGKECKFDTSWLVVVVQPKTIVGSTTTIVPDPETCEIKESGESTIVLSKK